MKVLLDTCTLIWWWSTPLELSDRARVTIEDPSSRVFVSAVSAWEIATKYRIGKLPMGDRVMTEWGHRLLVDRFEELPISSVHAFRAGTFRNEHRDPFDRMLAAQSIGEELPVVSPDERIGEFGAKLIW